MARLGLIAISITICTRMRRLRRRTGAKSLSTSLPEIPGMGFALVLRHVPLDVATLAAKAHPPMQWAGKPGFVARATPLPCTGIKMAGRAVEMALPVWPVQPMPCRLLICPTPRACNNEVLCSDFINVDMSMQGGVIFGMSRVVLGAVQDNRVVLGAGRDKSNISPPLP